MDPRQIKLLVCGVVLAVLGYVIYILSQKIRAEKMIDNEVVIGDKNDKNREDNEEDSEEGSVVENFYSVGSANVPTGFDESPENVYLLDDGKNRQDIILDNLCSKSCCSPQYPTPFNLRDNEEVCKNKGNYVKSNIFCNNPYQDSGCLCLTKNQAISLTTRGGNASSI